MKNALLRILSQRRQILLHQIFLYRFDTKFGMDWCGSSTPKTPEYQPINKEPINRLGS
jgi:hypothetical protein